MTKYIGKSSVIEFTYSATQSVVGQLLEITPANSSVGEVESTTLDSTRREFLKTILEDGVGGFRVGWDPDDAGHISMFNAFQSLSVDQTSTMSIVIRLATTLINKRIVKMTGFLNNFAPAALTIDGLLSTAVGFRLNSLTAPASST